jgi:integrase
MREKITDRLAASIKPNDGRRVEIIDTVATGLRFRANKDGSKSWSLLTTAPTGKKIRATLGAYPDLSVAEARKRAMELKVKIGDGYIPSAAKRSLRDLEAAKDAGITLGEGLELYAKVKLSQQRTGRETERDLRRDFGALLNRKAASIEPAMVAKIIDTKSKVAPIMARRLISYARPWFKWMQARSHISANPCDGIEAPGAERPRENTPGQDEIRAIWNASHSMNYPFGPFVRVMLLTGQRREEVAGMRRDELDLDAKTWTVPAVRSKTDRAINVPLSLAVVDEIRTCLDQAPGDELVFTTTGIKPISGFSKAKKRLDELSGVTGWRLHDFRRSMVSAMADMGVDPAVADRCLNHRASATLSTVARIYQQSDLLEQRRHATDAWCARVKEWVGEVDADSNIVPLRNASAE